jgi:hypothetical protein
MIEKLKHQHDQLREIGSEILALLDQPEPCDPSKLYELRWRLMRGLLQHLALEERCVYRPLEQEADVVVAFKARLFREELEQAYAGLQRYLEEWPPERIRTQWQEYAASARFRMRGFFDRMDREEAELFPHVDGRPDIGIRSPHDRNWAADGAAMRDRIAGVSDHRI